MDTIEGTSFEATANFEMRQRAQRPGWVNVMFDLVAVGERVLTAVLSVVKTKNTTEYAQNALIAMWCVGGLSIICFYIAVGTNTISIAEGNAIAFGVTAFLAVMQVLLGNMSD